MSTKVSKTGDKRKASSGEKSFKASPKKQKLEVRQKKPVVEKQAESSDFSDSDDGGVALTPLKRAAEKKGDKKPKEYSNGDAAKSSNGKASGSGAGERPGEKGADSQLDFAVVTPSYSLVTGSTSRESHAKQRQLAQERKAAKPLADELARTKKLWEKLRLQSHVPKDERQKLVDELYEIITGRMKEFVLKHDAVRAVQTAIKYSTADQRKRIAKELQGTYPQLAESRYAKFLIGKLLVQNDSEIRDTIIPEFYGKVRRLINHPEASWILDDIYRGAATKQQKARLLREWYGPEFALANAGSSDEEVTAELSEIIANEPAKKAPIMKYLLDMVNSLIQKKMTGFTLLHDAMLQYYLNLKEGSDEKTEFLEIVKEDEGGDLLKNMAFTKSGARLLCLLLAYGSAKDRKTLLKTFKDTFQLMSGDQYGHIVILAAYDLIDDTKLSAKSILPEILGKSEDKEAQNIAFCANDLNARTTILYLFEGTSKALFPASHSADLAILAEIHEIRKTTSKKDDETRRKELVAAASPQLLAAIEASPSELVASSFGCQLVTDVLLSAVGDKSKALEAIAATAAGDPNSEAPEDVLVPWQPHIAQTVAGGKMLKTLIAGGRFDRAAGKVIPADPPLNFANILYPHMGENVVQWATGPGSFQVLALLEAESFDKKAELKKVLKKNKTALEKAAKEETAEQKARREEAEKAEKEGAKDEKSKKKKKGPAKERTVGNVGSRMILEAL